MIVMVGNRYGSLFSIEDVNEKYQLRDVLEDGEIQISLTELEILLGTNHFQNIQNCIFCIKEGQKEEAQESNPYCKKRLDDLKEKIRNLPNANMFSYQDIDSFERNLTEQCERLLSNVFTQQKYHSQPQKAIADMDYFVEKETEDLVETKLSESDQAKIWEGETPIVLIMGENGSGKSSLLYQLYHKAKLDLNCLSLMHSWHMVEKIDQASDALITLVAYLQQIVLETVTVDYDSNDYLLDVKKSCVSLLKKCYEKTGKKLLYFLNNIEWLTETYESDGFYWLPNGVERYLKVVATCDQKKRPMFRDYVTIELSNELDEQDIKRRVNQYSGRFRKDLPAPVLDAFCKKGVRQKLFVCSLVMDAT